MTEEFEPFALFCIAVSLPVFPGRHIGLPLWCGLDNNVGLVDADACVSQTFDADCDHGILLLHFAELALEAFQRATDNAYMVAGLEDAVPDIDLCLALSEYELEVVDLYIGDDGGGALSGI